MSQVQRTSEEADLAALMRAAQNGDAASYRLLLEIVTPIVRRVILKRRYFLQSQDVDDLVQDVLVSLHSARATYDPRRAFIPWIAAIARNRLADGAQRFARRSAREVMMERLPEAYPGEVVNSDAETYGDHQALQLAIDRLPARQKQAITLLKLCDRTLEEAAGITGLSIGALKIATHRGMKTLRAILVINGEIENRGSNSTPVQRH